MSLFKENLYSNLAPEIKSNTMKTNVKLGLKILMTGIFMLFLSNGFSQTLSLEDKSEILVNGTSNVHDWTVEANDISGKLNFLTDSGQISSIESLTLTIPVLKMESGKDGMDKKMFKALNSDDHKTIQFKLNQALACNSLINNAGTLKFLGTLTVNGVKKPVEVNGLVKVSNNEINIQGSYDINMQDYGIEPPTALFGAINTGEKVQVAFNLFFNN